MAKVTGPLFSMSASGTVGKAITFGVWKGIAWVRKHFVPENPQTFGQTNQRYAMDLCVKYFQNTMTAPQKSAYEAGAAGTGKSGYNLWVSRALKEYTIQLTSGTTPVSVVVVGDYPADVITWSAV